MAITVVRSTHYKTLYNGTPLHLTSLQSFFSFSFAHLAIGQSQGVLLGLGGSVLTGLDGAGQQQQTARERLPHNQSVGTAAGAAGSSRPDKRVAAEAKVCRSGLDDVREPLQTPPTTPYKHSRAQ